MKRIPMPTHEGENVPPMMDEQAARAILSAAAGWIGWNEIDDSPDWQRGQIVLDGRFTMDELRAVMALARRRG